VEKYSDVFIFTFLPIMQQQTSCFSSSCETKKSWSWVK